MHIKIIYSSYYKHLCVVCVWYVGVCVSVCVYLQDSPHPLHYWYPYHHHVIKTVNIFLEDEEFALIKI